MKILDQLICTELYYCSQFSTMSQNTELIRYTDEDLYEMYAHNKTYIKQQPTQIHLQEIISQELQIRRHQKQSFLQVEFEGVMESLPQFDILPEIDILDYYYITIPHQKKRNGNPHTIVKEAVTDDLLNDGCLIDILANKDGMGEVFATSRIYRKRQVYEDSSSPVRLFVVYEKDVVIGNIEYMEYKKICKLEDFDIYEPYQRKGHGSSVLSKMIEIAHQNGIETIYLITSNDDTAKSMYEKCGFQLAGQKTSLLFRF